MLHACLFGRPVPPPPPPPALPPLTPAAYLRLRRVAAGLSADQVAERLATPERVRAEVRALVRQLERPGVVARHQETLEMLAGAFPFDPDVYRQLATEPADRHPPICRRCGCSSWDPCTGTKGVCSLERSLCTRCDGANDR